MIEPHLARSIQFFLGKVVLKIRYISTSITFVSFIDLYEPAKQIQLNSIECLPFFHALEKMQRNQTIVISW